MNHSTGHEPESILPATVYLLRMGCVIIWSTGYLHSLDYPFAFYLTIANKKSPPILRRVDMALRDRQLCAKSGSS